jgi:hypothetical protein
MLSLSFVHCPCPSAIQDAFFSILRVVGAIIVGGLAAVRYVPAHRASRVEPIVALNAGDIQRWMSRLDSSSSRRAVAAAFSKSLAYIA